MDEEQDQFISDARELIEKLYSDLEQLRSARSQGRQRRELAALAAQSKKQGAIAGSLRSTLPPEIARSLSEYDLQHTREAVREGAKLFIVSAAFGLETFDRNFRELNRLLGQSGEIISTGPGEPSTEDAINFRLLYAAQLVPGV